MQQNISYSQSDGAGEGFPTSDTSSDMTKTGRLERYAYKIFMTMLVLMPFVFIPTRYLALDLAKTIVIALGTLSSAIIFGVIMLKEHKVTAPPLSFFLTSLVLCIWAVVSSLMSIHIGKSLFGQGFEIGTSGFLILAFLGAWLTYEVVRRESGRAISIYGIIGVVFSIFFVFQGLRLMFGPSFISFGIFTSATSTLLGKWPELAILAVLVMIISVCGYIILSLPRKTKIIYSVLGIASLIVTIGINHKATWIAGAISMGLITLSLYMNASNIDNRGYAKILSRVSWLPAVLCIISIIMAFYGTSLSGPLIQRSGTAYSELTLPWQMTLDVVSGSVKNYPLFGVGPNHFAQAFMVYKPQGFNLTNIWSVEFNTGFGLIPTYIAVLGIGGAIMMILLFVFLGVALTKALKRLPSEPQSRFLVLSSAGTTLFLWIVSILYAPSHVMFFMTFIMTGVFLAVMTSQGVFKNLVISPKNRILESVIMPGMIALVIVVCIGGFLIYAKKTIALSYFAKGVGMISDNKDFGQADRAFRKAIAVDSSDVYWQAISENARLEASQLISTATTSSQVLAEKIAGVIGRGVEAARKAVEYDPSNYYNLVSEARISQLGATIKMANAYENTVRAYTDAIRMNPQNPGLYVNLAQFQASNGNLDQALQTLGSALQVKNNYLDAVFLISQIHAAKGNLNDAIVASQVAIQLNPSNPLLYFQMGLLQYNAQNFKVAAQALTKAIELQPDYANAKYFLGLSAARNGELAVAISQFDDLLKTNPDNKEIALILSNLRAGKSPFTNAKPPVTPTPEKRSSLPVKER